MLHTQPRAAWRCAQFWVGTFSLLLCLFGFYAFQQYATGVEAYPGPVPTIDANAPAEQTPARVDCSVVPCMALTFDDGPNPQSTPKIVDALEKAGARATFFVEGSHVPGNEALLRRMYQDGFEIGNHSWNHPDFTKLSSSQMSDQIALTQQAVMSAGLPAPRLFRPPFGTVSASMRSQVPLTIVFWNVDPRDWQGGDPNDIVAYVATHAGPGRIVDMHDTSTPTTEAIGPLLAKLKTKYHLVTVSELLNLNPGQRGEYSGR